LADNSDRQAISDCGNCHSPASAGVTGDGGRDTVGIGRIIELGLDVCRRGQKQQTKNAGPCLLHIGNTATAFIKKLVLILSKSLPFVKFFHRRFLLHTYGDTETR
jgi:hypothetical protein